MKYFTLYELLHSTIADANEIVNRCNDEQKQNLEALVEKVLDPAREKYGRPVYVSSGFRCKALNDMISGARASQHLKGEAADLYTKEGLIGNLQLAQIIVQNGDFDQLILEYTNGRSLAPHWVHVSWKREGYNRHDILKKEIGTAGYTPVKPSELLGEYNNITI